MPIIELIPIYLITLGKEVRVLSSALLRSTNYLSSPLPITSNVMNKEYIKEKREDNKE